MKHLVIIGLVIPEPASTAAGHRMMQLIHVFSEADYKITFLTASNNIEFSEKIEIQKIEINNESFDEKIRNLNPDVVLFDRYVTEEQFGWRVFDNCPNAVKIIDTEDLHFLREARRKAFVEKRIVEKADFINDVFVREIASILRCDLSLIISEFEYDLLVDEFKINPDLLFYIPFLTDHFEKSKIPFEERKHFVSIGNFLHEPNWQTVLNLKQIWKSIKKKLPEAELHIYGAYTSQKVLELHNEKDGFLVKGRADSVKEIFNQAKVLLAPIPFGAGLKGKLWESMKFGLPNVTSTIGAEAMHKDLPWNGFIEDSDEAFVEKAVDLYQNENLWNKAQENGYRILDSVYKKDLFADFFINKVSELMENLDNYRTENYLGKILQHHQLNSTKYMSRWIEEKNKK
ncbi:glycosyltransferase [Epilithonimonas ginsengisoli]|uniref:Glycosyltransferase n=1 Tax=Epilithonimonas ginsengisoli TaxID=1245592 RepID=A0ABU4JE13_9FLAO|nr:MULTISPECIES: glycosyltransferase [Chryseobacterium group]MBV6879391.1 glycosyltransferase [Epilithonimonas sp. FP105]MDW8547910.1 glycosyltransferase [Epilithonimonas ginsengisoli]OAH73162.1 glycosyltransferase [Chryseobacterium sp. FP211-J200]